tara:strand:+ start:26342 stop:27601 length:1260 start_codon:yes stop_codon:yes gene_type:complete
MANNFDSNITRPLAKKFLDAFETKRVLSKNVNTQFLANAYNPSTGSTVDIKRPTDYKSSRTAGGDISGGTAEPIITGKASATVQDYFTVELDWQEAEQALKMDQLDELIAPAAARIVTDMEVDFAAFMMANSGLLAGTAGTGVTTWDHVAEAGAIMQATGVPMDDSWCYAANPFTQRKLASNQRSLGGEVGTGNANEKAVITDNFAGLKVMTATSLSTFTTGSDRAGTLSSAPDATYATAKDTMKQSLAVAGFAANQVIAAGETVTIAGCNRLNLSTRQPVIDETGATVPFTGVVSETVTLSGTGTGTIVISGPAIYEAAGAYNTVDAAPANSAVVTLGGGASSIIQPNLFWHKQAFSIGSVPISKLYSTDTLAKTQDGLQIRVSKGASIRENKQIVRFDLRPAYGVNNPFFAGQGFGS